MGRREEKREATRQDILASAGILFMKKGYENTSVDDISAAANVAKGTFYYHFKSKDEVLLGLSIGYLKRLNESVDEQLKIGTPPLDVLMTVLRTTARDTEIYRELSRHFFLAMFSQMREQFDTQYKDDQIITLPSILTKIVIAAQAKGEIEKHWDARELGIMIAGLSHHAQVTWIILEEERPLVDKVEDWVRVIVRGVTTQ
ncbi:MAG: TetR/AcrR family transcriptional regulator [Candidatus Obscuribacterales bacterium]|nr:TetR/AcrR family transcriptional regulator [Candidatus Obscuribacterales bacterium]